jgi:hypothetical protein
VTTNEKRRGIVFVASFVLLACGGESSSGRACPVPAACGGNIVGAWRVTDSCLSSPKVLDLDCPGASATISNVTFSGTVVFGEDGTEVTTGHESSTVRYSFPTSCLKPACADAAASLSNTTAGNGAKLSGVSCSSSGDQCVCTGSANGAVDDHDTYTVNGNQITTVDGSDGSVTTESYCVQGNELTESGSGVVIHSEKQ